MKRNLIAAAAAAVMAAALALPAQAGNIVDEWASVKAPPAPDAQAGDGRSQDHRAADARFHEPELRQAAALRRLDTGDEEAAGRRARKGVTVVYSLIANTTPADVIKDVAPLADEPRVQSGPDKFLSTDLEKILKDKGITTVIVVGTAANGAVLYTASGAAFAAGHVIVPVDGMSSDEPVTPSRSPPGMLANGPGGSARR